MVAGAWLSPKCENRSSPLTLLFVPISQQVLARSAPGTLTTNSFVARAFRAVACFNVQPNMITGGGPNAAIEIHDFVDTLGLPSSSTVVTRTTWPGRGEGLQPCLSRDSSALLVLMSAGVAQPVGGDRLAAARLVILLNALATPAAPADLALP